MPECQQGIQRRAGAPQTSARCQKPASPCGAGRDPLGPARRAPTHTRTDRRAADLRSPWWPLIFEAQYNLRAVFTFLCHLTKYKAAKRERKRRGSGACARRLPPHPPPGPHNSPPTPDVLQHGLSEFLLDNEIRFIYIPRWKYTQCDSGKGTTWNLFGEPWSLLPVITTVVWCKLTSGWCTLDGSAFKRISPEMEFFQHGKWN